LKAAADLIGQAGGVVTAIGVLMELSFLPGRATLGDQIPITSLLTI
jgi:adenine phosphoribosyltransferase